MRGRNIRFIANAYRFMPVPGILDGEPQTDDFGPAPDGYSYIFNGVIKSFANDGSPYITNGVVTISLYQYQAIAHWVLETGFWDVQGRWFSDRTSWA